MRHSSSGGHNTKTQYEVSRNNHTLGEPVPFYFMFSAQRQTAKVCLDDRIRLLKSMKNMINNHRRSTMAVQKSKTKLFLPVSRPADKSTQDLALPMDYKNPVFPTAIPRFSSSSPSAIIQIFTSIHITIFERFRASTNQPKCLPPPSRLRPPTPPWEPTDTLTVSSCKVPRCAFALQTGSSNSTSERRHNYF